MAIDSDENEDSFITENLELISSFQRNRNDLRN